MAILKHIASKNTDYGDAQRYLIFQHDEYTGKPILDENSMMLLREEYYLDGIHCDPFTFDAECMELNARFHKNQNYNEIKSHHYIISFDPKDREENGLTGEQAQKLGLEYARKNFPGHQALICTHMDGHNGSGNIHVHIVINSLRKYDVEQQDFMERPCDSRAGNKHHLTKKYLVHLKQSLMDLCLREHLHQVDLLTPAEHKISEREYWAERRGQKKLDEQNKKMIEDGVNPRTTRFQTQKEYLRLSIDQAASSARSLKEFQQLLFQKYKITLKISRGRFSYLHPERPKPITGRKLGTHYEEKYLLALFEDNAKAEKEKEPSAGKAISPKKLDTFAGPDQNIIDEKTFSILFVKSNLRLVVDLQECVKTRESAAYARKVKLGNLKEMARTIAYIQEQGYGTREELTSAFAEAKSYTASSRKSLKTVEDRLRKVNEQIHYTGQYLANKSVYSQFCKTSRKGQFRKEHSVEISLYETARNFLKEHSADVKIPSMSLLKGEKNILLKQRKEAKEAYLSYQQNQKALKIILANVAAILDHPYSLHQTSVTEHEDRKFS